MQNEHLTDEQAYQKSLDWYIVNDIDLLSLRNISLGPSLQMYVFEKLYPQSQVNADTFRPKAILKKLGLEWSTRSIASLFSRDNDANKTQVLLLYDVNNNPAIESLNRVAVKLETNHVNICALTIDSTISKKCVVKNKISWFKCFGLSDYLKARSDSKKLLKNLNKKKSNLVQRLISFSIYKNITRQIPSLAREVYAIENILRKKQPSIVLMATDAHRVSRTTAQIARKLGIPSIVIQHGATIWKYGFIPVFADKMLVWGDAAKQWFISNGESEHKITVTGNVRYDTVEIPVLTAPEKDKQKLYFFPNPIDRRITSLCMQSFVKLVRNSGWEGCVKLHPSEQNIQFFKRMIPDELNSKIHLSTNNIFDSGITCGDIAIIVNSTAGIDACILGAKILNIKIKGMPNPVDYETSGVGITTTISNLDTAFEKVKKIPFGKFAQNRISFLTLNLGDCDGNATQRTCTIINEYIN